MLPKSNKLHVMSTKASSVSSCLKKQESEEVIGFEPKVKLKESSKGSVISILPMLNPLLRVQVSLRPSNTLHRSEKLASDIMVGNCVVGLGVGEKVGE